MGDVKAFQEKVKNGDLAGVRSALADDPALLNALNETGQSAFLLAKYYRQPQIAEYLLSLDPKLDLFDACVAGKIEKVLDEIDRDPSLLESHSSDGWTPLHLAAFFGQAELAKGLLNRAAAIDARSANAMANTPLHAATAGRSTELVKLLLERGADANARQHGGWTALQSAAQSGCLEIAKMLVAHGAEIGVRADNNQSALDMALSNGHGATASFLEQQGARLQ
jgi:ankyrin repeat protein